MAPPPEPAAAVDVVGDWEDKELRESVEWETFSLPLAGAAGSFLSLGNWLVLRLPVAIYLNSATLESKVFSFLVRSSSSELNE